MASVRVACTSAWRAPFGGRQRLPVAVLRLLAVAPRVSQRQEQQQRTQALAQLPRRRSSPARRRRHHRGRSRLLPGARALCPPCARLLGARRRRRLSPRQGAPEGRGVCATCEGTGAGAAVALGDQARSWGAECKFRRRAGERPGGWRGPGLLGRDGHTVTRLAGLSLGLRAPSCLCPGLCGGQGAESGRLLASYTRVARPRVGGAASPLGKRGAEGLTRFLPVVSWLPKTRTRTWAFAPGAPALGFPVAVFPEQRKEVVGRLRLLFQTAFHADR